MADFMRLSIFGTGFEVTTRYADLQPVGMGAFGLVWAITLPALALTIVQYGTGPYLLWQQGVLSRGIRKAPASARDQLTNQLVAVKKIVSPFSSSVLAKRTYRELKLLKHLRHENIISMNDVFISPLEDIYFVTELLGTDLHRLRQSRPLEK
ncbi:MAPK protein hog1, partial [Coemansia sp. RSA 1086]